MMQKKNSLQRMYVFIALGLAGLCNALDTDRQRPATIKSDRATLNQKIGFGEYFGHVYYQQGTSHLSADMATTKVNTHNQVEETTAKGTLKKRAHYWTTHSPNQAPIHAKADLIKYYPLEKMVILIGNAELSQKDDTFRAQKLRYDLAHHSIVTENESKQRVHIKLHSPKNKTTP